VIALRGVSEIRGVAVCFESFLVLIKPHYEASFGLPHIRFVTVRACQFVYPGLHVFVWCLLFMHQ
jgi:hypothetical protein